MNDASFSDSIEEDRGGGEEDDECGENAEESIREEGMTELSSERGLFDSEE